MNQAAPQILRMVKWFLIAVLAVLVTVVVFRGYLSPDMLLNFADSFHC